LLCKSNRHLPTSHMMPHLLIHSDVWLLSILLMIKVPLNISFKMCCHVTCKFVIYYIYTFTKFSSFIAKKHMMFSWSFLMFPNNGYSNWKCSINILQSKLVYCLLYTIWIIKAERNIHFIVKTHFIHAIPRDVIISIHRPKPAVLFHLNI